MKVLPLLSFLVLLPSMMFAQGGLLTYPPAILSDNLAPNPGFETGDFTGWTGSAWQIESANCHSGSYCATTTTCSTDLYQRPTLEEGKVYRISYWVKTDGNVADGGIRLELNSISSPYCAYGCGNTVVSYATTEWKYIEQTTIGISGDVTGWLKADCYSSPTMGQIWIDDISLYEELPQPVAAKLIQPSYRGYLWSDMDQEAIFEVTNNLGYIPVDAQDETSYDDTPTTEGTFSGGTGHAALDVITLDDKTEITVDAVSSGVVTEFTVDVASTRYGNASGSVLSQESTTGSGIDFSLTTGDDNVTNTIEQVVDLDPPGSPSVSDATITDGRVTVAIAADGTIAFRNKGQATPDYPEYRIETQLASARTTWQISWTDTNRFLVNDTETFLLGVYDSGLGYGSTEASFNNDWNNYRRLDEIDQDINSYVNYWWGNVPASNIQTMMDALEDRGMYYWGTANCFASSIGAAADRLCINDQTYAEDVADHPRFMGCYIMDECTEELADDLFAKTVVSREWMPKSADLVVSNRPYSLDLWYDVGDILSADAYMMPGAEPVGGYDFGKAARWASIVRQEVSDSRPFMMVLPFFKHLSDGRFPTEAELYNISIMSVAEGAQGILYWSIGNGTGALATQCGTSTTWCEPEIEYYTRLKNVAADLKAMESIFVAADDNALLTSWSNSNIGTLAKTGDYVLAYNDTNANQSVTFTWNTGVSAVVAKNEGSPDRTITPNGDKWTDSFGPYEAHVYAVTDGSPPAATDIDRINGLFSSTSVQVTWSDAALYAKTSCTATLKNAGGSTLDSEVFSEGFSTRSVGFGDLTPSTSYSVVVACTGFEDKIFAFSTRPALTGTASYSVAMVPNDVLTTAAKAKVEYRLPGGATSSETNASCGSGCSVSVTLNRGTLYEVRHLWLDASDNVLSTSSWRNVTVQ